MKRVKKVTKKQKVEATKPPERWIVGSNNFRYAVTYEIEDELGSDHYGYDGDGSGCDGICRCREITAVTITDICAESITDHIMLKKPRNLKISPQWKPFFRYALNRIITHSGALDKDQWSASWSRGYYGDEVDDISLDNMNVLAKIQKGLDKLVADSSPKNCVLTALEAEYGYILDGLDKLMWNIEKVPTNKITLPPLQGYTHMDPKVVTRYGLTRFVQDNPDFPIAVVIANDDVAKTYRLVDGRHRLMASKNADKKQVLVISGYDEIDFG